MRSVDDSRGWAVLHETNPGSWQRDEYIDQETVLSNWTVWACMTLIANDVAKCGLHAVTKRSGIWDATATTQPRILREPNHFQTRQQFLEAWVLSKLTTGNAYVLKQRDARGAVSALYVLDPSRVEPLVSPEYGVFYRLTRDDLAKVGGAIGDQVVVPSSEVIHDRYNTVTHPLIGQSPLSACGLAAMQSTAIAKNSSKFFGNMSRPSGVLSAPGAISNETALRLKESWDKNYAGDRIGKVAVLGDGLDYKPMGVTAADSQMVEQMKMTAEMICSVFHVPSFKVGAGVIPAGQKVEDLTQIYLSDCLDGLMDAIATLLTIGLNYTGTIDAVKFDLDDLLRMDSRTLAEVEGIKTQRGISSPNEARRKFNLPPVKGGNSPYLQQQEFSLEALAKRDAQADPFKTGNNSPDPSLATVEDVPKSLANWELRVREMEERAEKAIAKADEFRFCGSWKAYLIYKTGNSVNWGGGMWICKRDNPGKPGVDGEGWQLAVRRGADAKSYP